MVRTPWATYLWPGLPLAWQGRWLGLALAIGFAVLANALVLTTFVWVEVVDGQYLRYAWMATGVMWAGSAMVTLALGRPQGQRAAAADAMFRQAIHEYLKGNWFEVERILRRLLVSCPRDVEARLLLATLLRRTARDREALEELAELELWRDASKWSAEIAAEKQWISQSRARAETAARDSEIAIPSQSASSRAA